MLIVRDEVVVRPAFACVLVGAILVGALLLCVAPRWSPVVLVVLPAILICRPSDHSDDAGTGPGLPMQQQPAPDHGLPGTGPGLPMQQQPAPDHGLGASAIASLPAYAYEKKACSGGDECAVCLGEVQRGEVVKQLPACTHLFHEGCIDAWLRSHVTCPVCRSPVDAALPAAMEVVVSL